MNLKFATEIILILQQMYKDTTSLFKKFKDVFEDITCDSLFGVWLFVEEEFVISLIEE